MANYNSTLQTNNTDLQAILNKVNALPEAGSGGSGGFPNGTEWTQSNITSGGFWSVCNANGIWVAAGNNGIYYSQDGKNWTISNIKTPAYSVYYANGLWVAGAGNSTTGYLYYSVDGKTWNASNLTGIRQANIRCLTFCGNKWYACYDYYGFYYSTDGKIWEDGSSTANSASNSVNKITYNNGTYVLAGSTSHKLKYSNDGINFITVTGATSSVYYDVYYANGIWVAAGSGTIIYSIDGITWNVTNITSGYDTSLTTTTDPKLICYAKGRWIVCGKKLYTSTDGKVWSQITTNSSSHYVTCSNNIWICVIMNSSNYYKIAHYSTNGTTWIQSNLTEAHVYDAKNADGIWVAATSSGLYYSVTWEPTT